MSNLSEYIDKVKRYVLQNNLTETESVRYVYLDLGKRFSFNSNFSFGNSKTKKRIYDESRRDDVLEENMKDNIIICRSLSYILEKILKELGVNIETETALRDCKYCAHVYNVITSKEGKKYIIDLQTDLENIQSHSATKNFGISIEPNRPPIITRFELEQIDKKLGYIKDDFYYSDDYLYLLKSDIGYFSDLREKAEFVLENLEIYHNKEMKYIERRCYHEELLLKLFSKKELNKIHIIDCYKDTEKGRQYENCVAVEVSDGTDIYMFSIDENRYCKLTMEEFAEKKKNGLVNIQGIPGLRHFLRQYKEEESEL